MGQNTDPGGGSGWVGRQAGAQKCLSGTPPPVGKKKPAPGLLYKQAGGPLPLPPFFSRSPRFGVPSGTPLMVAAFLCLLLTRLVALLDYVLGRLTAAPKFQGQHSAEVEEPPLPGETAPRPGPLLLVVGWEGPTMPGGVGNAWGLFTIRLTSEGHCQNEKK